MMYLSKSLVDKWSQVPLFKRNVISISNICIENSLNVALEKREKLRFSEYLLDQRNEVTAYLSKHHREQDKLWNHIAIEINQRLVPIFEAKIDEMGSEYREIKASILYPLKMICIYKEYNIRGCVTSEFFDEMERIFESGYVPFGYEGKFPNGTWHVY